MTRTRRWYVQTDSSDLVAASTHNDHQQHRLQTAITKVLKFSTTTCYAFSALTLLVGCQEEHPACKH